ncbi:glycosyltransferase [Fictibacillus aquaticus]|uniref:Uncharacterized protein n=1 Tax=Fictibacillus aquaticus TaxID=2021314 RepID=A0A235FAE3_9BACL|nr:glycosyltransferase [Fictibacillus aquaticus]OYD57715.1 hypothetical protein CGZ90_13710 [Fictibacillus aquaticus]
MRILYITPRVPFPPRKGDQLRSYQQLKGLHKLGHDIHLISFGQGTVPQELAKICSKVDLVPFSKITALKNTVIGLKNSSPLQVAFYTSENFTRTIDHAIRNNYYDIVHSQLVRTFPYFHSIKELPNVIDFVDCISLNLNRRTAFTRSLLNPVFSFESKRIARLEKAAAVCYDGGIFISKVDKAAVTSDSTVTTISNGVDLDYFSYQHEFTSENNVVFVGNMSYAPNREGVKHFIQNIYPHIKITEFKLYIVGREPTKDIIALSGKYPNIVVTGEVPDIRTYLRRAKLFVCPLQTGAGVQNKVLEAMAAGVPVLTTSIVNDPIGGRDNDTIFVRNSDKDFAASITELLSKPAQLEQTRAAARQFVEQHYRWERLNRQLEQFYRDVIQKKRLNEVTG